MQLQVRRRELGIGMCITGLFLWLASLAVGAPAVPVVLSILVCMGGAVVMAGGDIRE